MSGTSSDAFACQAKLGQLAISLWPKNTACLAQNLVQHNTFAMIAHHTHKYQISPDVLRSHHLQGEFLLPVIKCSLVKKALGCSRVCMYHWTRRWVFTAKTPHHSNIYLATFVNIYISIYIHGRATGQMARHFVVRSSSMRTEI